MKTVFFIGQEKPLLNLKKYGCLEKFLKKDFLVLTTEEIASKYEFTNEVLIFKSSWTKKEWVTFQDYLYIKNFITTSRKTLNISLRTRLFGPYKLNSIKRMVFAFKYFYKFCKRLNFFLIYQKRNYRSTDLLMELRNKNILSFGDSDKIMSLLLNQNIEKAIAFTTLNDPILFDFIEVCKNLGINSIALPDCWDNISTSLAIPEDISKIYLWSMQQKSEIKTNYPQMLEKSEIYGSYRIKPDASEKLFSEKNTNDISILYLESNVFEDRNFVINKIAKCISETEYFDSLIQNVKFIIREYPGYRPSEPGFDCEVFPFKNFIIGECKFEIIVSKNEFLRDDLAGVNLVFSELTTAGLEAAFEKIPTIFIGSNQSPRFITTFRVFHFSFAQDLFNYFPIIKLDSKSDSQKLTKFLNKFIEGRFRNSLDTNENFNISKKLTFLAEAFDYDKWESESI